MSLRTAPTRLALLATLSPRERGEGLHRPRGTASIQDNHALQRFAAHQPRLRGRLDAFAHHGAAQRRDAIEQIEPEAARALHREEIRQAGCD